MNTRLSWTEANLGRRPRRSRLHGFPRQRFAVSTLDRMSTEALATNGTITFGVFRACQEAEREWSCLS